MKNRKKFCLAGLFLLFTLINLSVVNGAWTVVAAGRAGVIAQPGGGASGSDVLPNGQPGRSGQSATTVPEDEGGSVRTKGGGSSSG